jgi:hypothetical protein
MATNGPCIMVTWTICKNHLLEVGLTHRIGGTHGTPDAHNRWLILFYHAWGLTWLKIHWDNIWLKAQSHMTSHYTWRSMSTRHDFGGGVGTAIGHFLLGSHNFMVTALGSCVKCPLIQTLKHRQTSYTYYPKPWTPSRCHVARLLRGPHLPHDESTALVARTFSTTFPSWHANLEF